MAYRNIMIEICGKCNARCLYCYTGLVNRGVFADEGGCIAPETFEQALDFLRGRGLSGPETHFCLYNYGEPLMHPELAEILRIMDSRGNTFELSTNGSVPLQEAAVPYLRHMTMLKISMCGFTQESYDRISMLNLHQVKTNVKRTLELLRGSGWDGIVSLKFHVYRHNLDEIEPARRYAEEHGMVFSPIHAIIGDLRLQTDYMDSCAESAYAAAAARDLLSADLFAPYAAQMPAEWVCSLTEDLVIDERLLFVNCCMATRHDAQDYKALGSLFDIKENVGARCGSALGRRCWRHGVGYAINSLPTYRGGGLGLDRFQRILEQEEIDVIGGGFVCSSFSRVFAAQRGRWTHYADAEDYLSRSPRRAGIILADARFLQQLARIRRAGIPEEQVRAVYHFNLL